MQIRLRLKQFIKGRKSESGSAAVEFALVAPVLIAIMMGLIDFGRLFWTKNTMQFAVDETARFAMVNPASSPATLTAYATNRISGSLTGVTFTATPTTISGVDYQTINAQFTYNHMIPFVPLGTTILTARSSSPVNDP